MPVSPGCDVLVVGPWFVDLLFLGVDRPPSPGIEVRASDLRIMPGGAFIPVAALLRLGRRVAWATDFGDDAMSAHVLELARREGASEAAFRRHDRALANVTVVLSDADERAMLTYEEHPPPPPLGSLLRELRPRVLLFSRLEHGAVADATIAVARELGITVYMDCQDVPATLASPVVARTLRAVDVFAPNRAEALRLTGASSVDAALDVLAQTVDTAVVTCGAGGARAVSHGRRLDVAAPQVDVLDTTGAGDAFNAGFVHGLLAGSSLRSCLRLAVAAGSASTTGPGWTAVPRAAALDGWLARVGAQAGTDSRSTTP